MRDSSNFFKDFIGLDHLKIPQVGYSFQQCQYDRMVNIFKGAPDFEMGSSLLYLEYLRQAVRKHIVGKISHDEYLHEEYICENVMKILKEYKYRRHFNKYWFSRLQVNTLKNIEMILQYIVDRLPWAYFERHQYPEKSSNLNVKNDWKLLNSVFYIPLREKLSETEKNMERDKISALSLLYVGEEKHNIAPEKTGSYPLKTMFEIYKDSIPNYSYFEFQSIVENQLTSGRSDDDIVAYLLDIFGCTVFEFISDIVTNRQGINYGVSQVSESTNSAKVSNKTTSNAFLAGSVTVLTEKETSLLKKLRKFEKRDKTKTLPAEVERTEAEYEVARSTPLFKRQRVARLDPEVYPHVHDQMRDHMVTTKYDGISIVQPENAVKKSTSEYVEFTIPGGKKGDDKTVKLVQVSSLDIIGKLVFNDITEFNRIQSEVFPVAYNSNENMLVCAPTGAGKTNIALLSIVHQIRCHLKGSLIKKSDFKIVYVCPMKALATEMVLNFRKKLAPIGISVKECTGDMQLSKAEIEETQMLVTTPEKWDVITRKGAGVLLSFNNIVYRWITTQLIPNVEHLMGNLWGNYYAPCDLTIVYFKKNNKQPSSSSTKTNA